MLQYEPSRHVDYLSHDWKESDISACWRNIVSRRRDVTNSARLENASWRTWTKAKYNLRTVSPESVNWLKDCDITWLYGPLYNQPSNVYYTDPHLQDDSEVTKIQVDPVPGHKPILKKRTVSDKIFARQAGTNKSPDTVAAVPKVEINQQQPPTETPTKGNPDYDGGVSTYLRHHNYRHRPHHGQSDENISRQINLQYRHMPGHLLSSRNKQGSGLVSSFSLNKSLASSTGSTLSVASVKSGPPAVRHIHFNDRVEQCIALEEFSDDEDDDTSTDSSDDEGITLRNNGNSRRWSRHGARDEDSSSEEEDDSEEDEDEDEPGLFLTLRSSSSSSSLHRHDTLQGLRTTSSSHIPQTIAPLPATTLNCAYDEAENLEREAEEANSVAYAMSHNTQTRKHIYSTYDYNSVYEAPATVEASSVKVPAAPSSVLSDNPASVAMPSHLRAQLEGGEIVLPPVLVGETEKPQVELPVVSSPVQSSSPQMTASVAVGQFDQVSQSASAALLEKSGSDPNVRDLDEDESVSSRLTTAASSAKSFARGLLPSGWKKAGDRS